MKGFLCISRTVHIANIRITFSLYRDNLISSATLKFAMDGPKMKKFRRMMNRRITAKRKFKVCKE